MCNCSICSTFDYTKWLFIENKRTSIPSGEKQFVPRVDVVLKNEVIHDLHVQARTGMYELGKLRMIWLE